LKLENIFVSGIASTEITASGNSGDGFSDGFPGASFGVHCADFYGASGGVKCSESQGFCAGAGGLVTIATSGSSGSCASSSSRCDYNVHRTTNKHDYSSSGSFGSSSSSSGRTAANHAQLNSSECTHSSNRSSFSACSGSITYSRCFCHTSGVTNRGNDSSPFSLPSSRSGVVPTWTAATAANNVQGTRGEKLRNAAPIRVRVGDFGVSAFVKPGEKLSSVTGSPYYIAPEVLQNYYGPEADVWSLGIVVYMLLCGYPPFFADEPVGIFEKVLGGGDADVSHGPWKSISGQAKDLVSRLLVRDPAKRIRPSEILKHSWLLRHTSKATPSTAAPSASSSSSAAAAAATAEATMTARCGPSFKPLRPLSVQLPTQDSPHDSPHQHSARSLRHQSARSRHLPSAMSPHDLSISVPHHQFQPATFCTADSPRSSVTSPQPSVNSPRPSVNSPRSSFNSCRPSVNSHRPSVNCPRPSVNSPHPSVNSPRSSANSPRPSANSPRPSIKHISGGVKNKGGGEKKEGRGNKGRAWHKGDLSRSGSLDAHTHIEHSKQAITQADIRTRAAAATAAVEAAAAAGVPAPAPAPSGGGGSFSTGSARDQLPRAATPLLHRQYPRHRPFLKSASDKAVAPPAAQPKNPNRSFRKSASMPAARTLHDSRDHPDRPMLLMDPTPEAPEALESPQSLPRNTQLLCKSPGASSRVQPDGHSSTECGFSAENTTQSLPGDAHPSAADGKDRTRISRTSRSMPDLAQAASIKAQPDGTTFINTSAPKPTPIINGGVPKPPKSLLSHLSTSSFPARETAMAEPSLPFRNSAGNPSRYGGGRLTRDVVGVIGVKKGRPKRAMHRVEEDAEVAAIGDVRGISPGDSHLSLLGSASKGHATLASTGTADGAAVAAGAAGAGGAAVAGAAGAAVASDAGPFASTFPPRHHGSPFLHPKPLARSTSHSSIPAAFSISPCHSRSSSRCSLDLDSSDLHITPSVIAT
ncbi:hypothetical protein CLOM_g9549, partial [Closterium sp. NIES-68]